MWNDSQVEFQLKLYTFESIVTAKCNEIKVIEARLDSIGSKKIQSQDQILSLIAEVHQTMKYIEKMVREIKEPCASLQLNSFYDLVKNMSCVLIGSIKLLSESFESGVQRNLVKYRNLQSHELHHTVCTQQEAERAKKNDEECRSILKNERFGSEIQIQMEIDRLYQHILAEKQSVLRTSASSAFMKLNEVRMGWIKLMGDSDGLLQEAFYKNNEELKQDLPEKIYKPQYISKVLRQELSQSLKGYFKQYAEKAMKRMHEDFYSKQYKRIRQQILSEKPSVKNQSQQTEADCFAKIKQVMKEKKIGKQFHDAINQKKQYKKLAKELQQTINQKKEMSELNSKLTKSNQAYLNKIQQLEKKLIKFTPVRSLEKKQSIQSRSSIRYMRKNSIRPQAQDQIDLQDLKTHRNLFKTVNQGELNPKFTFLQTPEMPDATQIIKKKKNFKKINLKSQMYAEQRNLDELPQMNLKKAVTAFQETENSKDFIQKPQKIKQISLRSIENSLKQIKQQQYKNTMAEILGLVDKMSSSQKERNSIPSQNSQSQKAGQKQPTSIAEKALSNPQICSIFQNFVKRIISNSITKIDQIKNEREQSEIIQSKKRVSALQGQLVKTEITKRRSTKQNVILTNDLLVKFLSQPSQDIAQSQDYHQQNSQISGVQQTYFQKDLKEIPELKKEDAIELKLIQSQKNQIINEKSPDLHQKMPQKGHNLLKQSYRNAFFLDQIQNMSRDMAKAGGRFQKFKISKPNHFVRQTEKVANDLMKSFQLRNNTERQKQKIKLPQKAETYNNSSANEKLICVKKIEPKKIENNQEDIVNIMVEFCKNDKIEEFKNILSRLINKNSRNLQNRQISKMSSKFIKGISYRNLRLQTS